MWIEVHQSLPRHPKLLRLAVKLGVTKAQAAGHLQFLWLWAVDYAPDGSLAKFDPVEIAAAADWIGDASAFLVTLLATGWLDESGCRIHDWADYGGKIIEFREKDAERKRLDREKKRLAAEAKAGKGRSTDVLTPSPGPAEDVRGMSNGRPMDKEGSAHPETSDGCPPDVQGMSAVPYHTLPNQPVLGTLTAGEALESMAPTNANRGEPFPTLETALAFADRAGITRDCATKWFYECDARGGLDRNGQPVTRWKSALQAFGVAWRGVDGKNAMMERGRNQSANGGRPGSNPPPSDPPIDRNQF